VAAGKPDRHTVTRFSMELQCGLFVMKHGRRGRPHARTVYSPTERPSWATPGELSFRCVCWDKPQKVVMLAAAAGSTAAAVAAAGTAATRVGLQLVPKEESSIQLRCVTQVLAGKGTAVLRRPDAEAIPAEVCLSLVAAARTLDLQLSSRAERDRVARCLVELIVEEGGAVGKAPPLFLEALREEPLHGTPNPLDEFPLDPTNFVCVSSKETDL
jgi:hypothetical protein